MVSFSQLALPSVGTLHATPWLPFFSPTVALDGQSLKGQQKPTAQVVPTCLALTRTHSLPKDGGEANHWKHKGTWDPTEK